MYTIDCEDPNCGKCRQATEGQHSEEENENKIQMTAEELVSRDLLLASNERTFCLEACRKIKDEIHYRINRLICVLRERERDLCTQVEQECCTQMAKIDHDATVQCIDKLLKRNSESEKAPCRTKLVFNCEFDFIFSELKKFGQLSYEDPLEHFKKKLAKTSQELKQQIGKSTIPLDSPLEAASKADYLLKMMWDLEELEIMHSEIAEDNFKRSDHLKRYNDIHKCARDFKLNEELEIFRKSSKEKRQYFEEGTDSVFSKEVGKDSSPFEKLKNLIKDSEDEGQHIEKDTDSVSSKEVGKDSLLTEGGKENIRRLRRTLQQLKLQVKRHEAKDNMLLMSEKLKNLIKDSEDEGQHFEEGADSLSSKEVENDCLSDDDMEIISKSEAAAIPSELPPLPPKNRFKFGRKRSWCPSLYSKKLMISPENNAASERPLCCKTKSQKCVTAFLLPGMSEVEQLPSFNEQASQQFASKCSISHDSNGVKKSDLTGFMAESKEIPSFNEQSNQASSSECLGDSNAEGQSHDPSAALLYSFKKYLEKNPECEWLAPEKSSEQSLSSGNSCVFNRHMPFLVENLDQWLSTKYKQEIVSDWLYTAQV